MFYQRVKCPLLSLLTAGNGTCVQAVLFIVLMNDIWLKHWLEQAKRKKTPSLLSLHWLRPPTANPERWDQHYQPYFWYSKQNCFGLQETLHTGILASSGEQPGGLRGQESGNKIPKSC